MSCGRKQFYSVVMHEKEEASTIEGLRTSREEAANVTINVIEDDQQEEDSLIRLIPTINTEVGKVKMGVNLVNQILIVLIISLITWKCISLKLKKTAMHGFLCSLGSVFFLSEGIMTNYTANILLYEVYHSSKIILHVTFNFIVMILTCAGIICKYKQKTVHFNTSHGKFGVVALLLHSLNVLCGFCVLLSHEKQMMKFMHAALGIAGYVTIMVAQLTSYDTGFFQRNFTNILFYKAMTCIVTCLTFDALFEFATDIVSPIHFECSNMNSYNDSYSDSDTLPYFCME